MQIIEREVVRLVVLDVDERVLLFHTRDPTYPELGTWWELPGGGLDPGETHQMAAVRELAEETGISVEASQLGAATWRRSATYRYRGQRRISHERILPVRLNAPGPAVRGDKRVDFEDEDYFDYRWWPVEEIIGSGQRFYPGRLPELLGPFLAGEEIGEPFEDWS